MGEGQGRAAGDGGWLFEPEFNRAIKLRQADPRITSNAGALLLREVDHRLGLTADLAAQLTDSRRPDRIRYAPVELLRQHLYALALGYAHQDDQDVLAHDPALKLAVWDRPGDRGLHERLASQPTTYRLLDRLATPSNRRALRAALSEWVSRHQRAAGRGRKVTHGTLDIDPFPIEVHGRQPGGAYHGYYRQTSAQPATSSIGTVLACIAGVSVSLHDASQRFSRLRQSRKRAVMIRTGRASASVVIFARNGIGVTSIWLGPRSRAGDGGTHATRSRLCRWPAATRTSL